MRPDVLVLGVGRSGTSTTSRILHTRLDVCMGHHFFPRNPAQPQGTFEDRDMIAPTKRLVGLQSGHAVARTQPRCTPEDWLSFFSKAHRGCGSRLLGCKSTHTCLATREQLEALGVRLIVRTYRPEELTVRSLCRWRRNQNERHWNERHWRKYFRLREEAMDASLEGAEPIDAMVCVVDFSERRTDEWIESVIRPYVEMLRDDA